ncbi:MAG: hypothetical protein CMO98_13900 [Woeseia sp.]|nr:hypothetical protein [Woeseia sp.]
MSEELKMQGYNEDIHDLSSLEDCARKLKHRSEISSTDSLDSASYADFQEARRLFLDLYREDQFPESYGIDHSPLDTKNWNNDTWCVASEIISNWLNEIDDSSITNTNQCPFQETCVWEDSFQMDAPEFARVKEYSRLAELVMEAGNLASPSELNNMLSTVSRDRNLVNDRHIMPVINSLDWINTLTLNHDGCGRIEQINTMLENRARAIKNSKSEVSYRCDESNEMGLRQHLPNLFTLIDFNWRVNEGVYIGTVDNEGNPHGWGFKMINSQEAYYGEWRSGLKHGTGKYILNRNENSGSRWIGQWRNDVMCGKGQYFENIDLLGRRQKFQEAMSKKPGENGRELWKELLDFSYSDYVGAIYTGLWENNKRHGKGIQTDYHKDTFDYYCGNWEEGVESGEGIWIESVTPKDLNESQFHYRCRAIFEWENSDYDFDVSKMDKLTATGSNELEDLTELFTSITIGSWKEGDLKTGVVVDELSEVKVSSSRAFHENLPYGDVTISGIGIIYFPDQSEYQGPIEDSQPHGSGILYYPDGSQEDVIYCKGVRSVPTVGSLNGRSVNWSAEENQEIVNLYIEMLERQVQNEFYIKAVLIRETLLKLNNRSRKSAEFKLMNISYVLQSKFPGIQLVQG